MYDENFSRRLGGEGLLLLCSLSSDRKRVSLYLLRSAFRRQHVGVSEAGVWLRQRCLAVSENKAASSSGE